MQVHDNQEFYNHLCKLKCMFKVQGNKLLHLQRNWMWSANLGNRCVCTRNPVIVIFHIIQSIFPNMKHANVCLIKIQVANALLLFICHHVVVLKWTWWKRRFGHMCTFFFIMFMWSANLLGCFNTIMLFIQISPISWYRAKRSWYQYVWKMYVRNWSSVSYPCVHATICQIPKHGTLLCHFCQA